MPSSNSALRARSNGESSLVRVRTARAEAMPKLSLYRRPSASRCASPGDSYVPANHEPIMTLDAPAASASATSRGCRTPPSAQTCLPSSRASRRALQHGGELRPPDAGHHAGRAHRAGADADLDDVRARLDQVAHALGGRRRCPRRSAPAGRARGPRAPPRASAPGGRARCRRRARPRRRRAAPRALPATSPLMPTRRGDAQARPRASVAGRVERGAQRAVAGEDAGERPSASTTGARRWRPPRTSRSNASRGRTPTGSVEQLART